MVIGKRVQASNLDWSSVEFEAQNKEVDEDIDSREEEEEEEEEVVPAEEALAKEEKILEAAFDNSCANWEADRWRWVPSECFESDELAVVAAWRWLVEEEEEEEEEEAESTKGDSRSIQVGRWCTEEVDNIDRMNWHIARDKALHPDIRDHKRNR